MRGESRSEGKSALQAGIDADLERWYFGAMLTATRTGRRGASALAYGGYAQPIDARWSWEAGAIRYVFRPEPGNPNYDYTDFFAGAASDSFGVRMYVSRNYYSLGKPAYYAEASGSKPFGAVRWFAKLGYLYRSSPQPPLFYGVAASAADFKVGCVVASKPLHGASVELAVTGTSVGNDRCIGYSGHCAPAFTAAISKSF